eukprot:396148_1
MTAQELMFRQIDDALAIYYHRLGINNYVNCDGNGKFMQYTIDEEFVDPDLPISGELGTTCNPNDCIYTCFINANEFPVPIDILVPNANKSAYIFYVLQYCWIYGHPPSNEDIKQQVMGIPRGSIHSAVMRVGDILINYCYHKCIIKYCIGRLDLYQVGYVLPVYI